MKMRDVIEDHGLDARDNESGSFTTTCPVCGQMGGLQIDMRSETFRCRVAKCQAKGDAITLDRLFRRPGVRENWKIHPGIKRDDE